MQCTKVTLPEEQKQIKIEIFSDLHMGSTKYNHALVQKRIKKVEQDPDRYAIILGDLLNNSTKTSVGDVYEEEISPMQQVKLAVETFRPIKDKIIGVVSGNHERRSYKQDGIDLIYFMCSELGIQDKYGFCSLLIFLRLGKHCKSGQGSNFRSVTYTIYIAHGDGQGGRTTGGKVNGLERRGQIINADIIVTGHTHAPITFRNKMFSIRESTNTVTEREQVFVNASSALKYEEYAELMGMKPQSNVSPVIILSGTKKDISVRI